LLNRIHQDTRKHQWREKDDAQSLHAIIPPDLGSLMFHLDFYSDSNDPLVTHGCEESHKHTNREGDNDLRDDVLQTQVLCK